MAVYFYLYAVIRKHLSRSDWNDDGAYCEKNVYSSRQRATRKVERGGVPSGRNGAINAYRFLFAVVIALLHFRYYGGFGAEPTGFRGGYLAVEFFFLTSGFFLIKRIEEQWG